MPFGTVPNFFCLRLHGHPGTVPEIASEEGEHAQTPIRSLLARFHAVLPVYTGAKRNVSKWNCLCSGFKRARIADPNWNGSNSSRVNARPIRTSFGTVPFGTVPFSLV